MTARKKKKGKRTEEKLVTLDSKREKKKKAREKDKENMLVVLPDRPCVRVSHANKKRKRKKGLWYLLDRPWESLLRV